MSEINRFYEIYKNKINQNESSTALINFLDENLSYKCKTVLDLGCGNLEWISKCESIKNANLYYLGVDIIPELIKYNEALYPWFNGVCEDLESFIKWPKADIVILRDVLKYHCNNTARDIIMYSLYNKWEYLIISTTKNDISNFKRKKIRGGNSEEFNILESFKFFEFPIMRIERKNCMDLVIARGEGHFDYIEIGISHFDTILHKSIRNHKSHNPPWKGISMDGVSFFLDKLPTQQENIKVLGCMGLQEGCGEIYYIDPDQYKPKRIPVYLSGYSKLNSLHEVCVDNLNSLSISPEEVVLKQETPIISAEYLIKKYSIKTIGYLKLQTNDNDLEILSYFIECFKDNYDLLPGKISLRMPRKDRYKQSLFIQVMNFFKLKGYIIDEANNLDIIFTRYISYIP